MPELLLELGTEELPATAVRRAFTELGGRIASQLEEARVLAPGSTPTLIGTPRRLIVSFPDVAEKQEDATKEQRGPGLKAAYNESGDPSPALLGFCKSQGIDPAEQRNDGQYVWVTKKVPGQPTTTLLEEILPKAIRSLTFDKTMRWGSSRLRFARPIRWILASFAGQLVPFDIEGVHSSLQSCGHRFYAPERFDAANLSDLISGLRARKAEPDPAVREKKILEEAQAVSTGTPDLPTALVDENVFLTEWPTAIEGVFHESFLELPSPVLVTAMAKHEKMFPVRDREGKLTNRFVFIRNSGEDESVRKGCEWVLNARFNDAKFFFDEDRRHTFEEFLEKTSGIVFQEKLGTVRQRCDRLSHLAQFIAPKTQGDEAEIEYAKAAGLFSKADLSTGLVSELASLQGIVGAEYGRREGFPGPVCWAIESQYDLAKNPLPDSPESRTAVRLVMADQLDKLTGYLGIGLEPTGSSDPFALRRAASLLIEAAWSWPALFPSFSPILWIAQQEYKKQGLELDFDALRTALEKLFASRYPAMMPGVRYDVLEAALACDGSEVTKPQGVRYRVRLLEMLAEDTAFIQTATRPINIVAAAEKKGVAFEREQPIGLLKPEHLESTSGNALFQLVQEQEEALWKAVNAQEKADALRIIRSYQAPVNQFFEETMVMVEEPEIRFARLSLLEAVAQQFRVVGDFSKIVIEG